MAYKSGGHTQFGALSGAWAEYPKYGYGDSLAGELQIPLPTPPEEEGLIETPGLFGIHSSYPEPPPSKVPSQYDSYTGGHNTGAMPNITQTGGSPQTQPPATIVSPPLLHTNAPNWIQPPPAKGLVGLQQPAKQPINIAGFQIPAPPDQAKVDELSIMAEEYTFLEKNEGQAGWDKEQNDRLKRIRRDYPKLKAEVMAQKRDNAQGLDSIQTQFDSEIQQALMTKDNQEDDRAALLKWVKVGSELAHSQSPEAKQAGAVMMDVIKRVDADSERIRKDNADAIKEEERKTKEADAVKKEAKAKKETQIKGIISLINQLPDTVEGQQTKAVLAGNLASLALEVADTEAEGLAVSYRNDAAEKKLWLTQTNEFLNRLFIDKDPTNDSDAYAQLKVLGQKEKFKWKTSSILDTLKEYEDQVAAKKMAEEREGVRGQKTIREQRDEALATYELSIINQYNEAKRKGGVIDPELKGQFMTIVDQRGKEKSGGGEETPKQRADRILRGK